MSEPRRVVEVVVEGKQLLVQSLWTNAPARKISIHDVIRVEPEEDEGCRRANIQYLTRCLKLQQKARQPAPGLQQLLRERVAEIEAAKGFELTEGPRAAEPREPAIDVEGEEPESIVELDAEEEARSTREENEERRRSKRVEWRRKREEEETASQRQFQVDDWKSFHPRARQFGESRATASVADNPLLLEETALVGDGLCPTESEGTIHEAPPSDAATMRLGLRQAYVAALRTISEGDERHGVKRPRGTSAEEEEECETESEPEEEKERPPSRRSGISRHWRGKAWMSLKGLEGDGEMTAQQHEHLRARAKESLHRARFGGKLTMSQLLAEANDEKEIEREEPMNDDERERESEREWSD
eukprot:GHVU01123453.1.p1 GENE.GHVU01123453.1~~GHVU01123453.1.p1  ORF type:complete len:420 (+),score=86.09 GHVU01123453.1:184-1260(+)